MKKKMRGKKGEMSRGEKVAIALMNEICFACGEKTIEKAENETFPESIVHVCCPKCQWEAIVGRSSSDNGFMIMEGNELMLGKKC